MSHHTLRTSTPSQELRRPRPTVRVPEPVQWLFRTNIPRRKASFIPASPGRRNFFGLGEIAGVLSNPASTVRSLTESQRLLEQARREIHESRERAPIRPTHAFTRSPDYFTRRNEQQAIERVLEGEPSFTVLFGPPSSGKTALLREILSSPRYHVLHFDLRIAGFADLESLYMSLSVQMEDFFEDISRNGGWYTEGSAPRVVLTDDGVRDEGWDTFERDAWSFRHDRISLQRRVAGQAPHEGDTVSGGSKGEVRPSDIARLLELFRSSLLRYREFEPSRGKVQRRRQNSEDTVVAASQHDSSTSSKKRRRKWFSRRSYKSQEKDHEPPKSHSPLIPERPPRNAQKRVPVIFFDEAHKLPHLIPSAQTMQALLDSTLVLTKQDRLCHVVHATSDPFYQGWLSRVGVLWYCKMIAIGNLSKAEMRAYFLEKVQPRFEQLPSQVKRLDFETIFDAFGGKIAHWHDFVTDHVNSGGAVGIKQSSHFLQAHALLNLHIIHSSQAPGGGFDPTSPNGANAAGSTRSNDAANLSSHDAHRASPEAVLHPGLGPAGFRMYQAGSSANHANFMGSSFNLNCLGHPTATNPLIASFTPYEGVGMHPDFSPMQLLKVMSRFTSGGLTFIPYFHLCRELGAKAVDAMIRGKVVDVKWTDVVPGATVVAPATAVQVPPNAMGSQVTATQAHTQHTHTPSPSHIGHTTESARAGFRHMSEATVTTLVHEPFGNNPPPPPFTEEDDSMVPLSEEEILARQQQQHQHIVHMHPQMQHSTVSGFTPVHYGVDEGFHEEDDFEDEEEEVIGPKLVPVSPIMRYAMREVIKEYEDDQSVSEYASLSDVEEY